MATAELLKYDSQRLKVGSAPAVAFIRVQPATAALTISGTENAGSSGTANINIRVRVGGSARKLGVRAAFATIRATAANAKFQPYSYHRIPLLNSAIQAAAAAADSTTTISYSGSSAFQFIDFNAEKIDGK
jgi:hypothetical protein